MYFFLTAPVYNADMELIHAGGAILHICQLADMALDFAIDTIQCAYGEVGMTVTIEQLTGTTFSIGGRSNADGETIFEMMFEY